MRAPRSTFWPLFNLILAAAAAAVLGWGPLAAPPALIVALGLTGAAIGGAIGWWSRPPARRRIVWAGHGLILLSVALAALIPLYRIGMIAPPGESHRANFQRLWRALDYAYPCFEQKGVDRDTLYASYAPQAAAAASDGDYWRVVASMLAELDDGHTGLLSPSVRSGRRYFAVCRAHVTVAGNGPPRPCDRRPSSTLFCSMRAARSCVCSMSNCSAISWLLPPCSPAWRSG